MTLRETWVQRYRDAPRRLAGMRVLTAFNANIDVIRQAEDIDCGGVEPVQHDFISSIDQLRQQLQHALETRESTEVDTSLSDPDIGPAEERIGGQAGIMATFLAGIGVQPVFYTPVLSQELAAKIPDSVYSVTAAEDGVRLGQVGDCVNADRTKRNLIFEFGGDHPGRLILSADIDGFSPSFDDAIEPFMDQLSRKIDRFIFSGYHNIPPQARDHAFNRAEHQLQRIGKEIHLEYVYKNDATAERIADHVLPYVDSIGLDEHELRMISRLHDMSYHDNEDISLEDAYAFARELIDRFGVQRVHIHTYAFHVTVTTDTYRVDRTEIRRAMVFSELAAIMTAEKGDFATSEDLAGFDLHHKHFNGFDELQRFGERFGIDDFASHGHLSEEGYCVVATPVLIHEQPRRLVGLGDIISSAAFAAEVHDEFQ